MIDFDKINAAAMLCLESICCELLPGGVVDGREYRVGQLEGGKGHSMGVNLRKGVWKDFRDGPGGSDPISLVAAVQRVSMGEAARWLDEKLNAGGFPERKAPKAKGMDCTDPDDWEAMPFVPPTAPPPPEELWCGSAKGKLKPTLRHAYFDAERRLVGYTNRVEWKAEGATKKDVLPLCWCQHKDGKQSWRSKSFLKPRPLYRMADLLDRRGARVLIVEGEKTADAAQRLLPDFIVMSWPGGCKAVGYADWSPLEGESVLIWPDYDLNEYPNQPGVVMPEEEQAGLVAARKIAELTGGFVIMPPLGLTKSGWDLADAEAEGWTTEQVMAHIDAAQAGNRLYVPGQEPEQPPMEDVTDYGDPEWQEEPPPAPPPPQDDVEEFPFRILGHNKGLFYYLPNSGRQIVELSPTAHSTNNLLQLARLTWWETSYPGKRGFNAIAAANDLMQRAFKIGIFDKSLKRGRGCWIDQGRTVYHVGNCLIVDAIPTDIHAFKSNYIYELSVGMEPETSPPCSNTEAAKLITLCEALAWERPLDAYLLAGWCVVAPICGALGWRPAIWITGPSQSGKTWTCDNIVKALVGKIMLESQGGTTAAGIRAALQSDARPVYKDESEDPKIMAEVLELVRCATSDDSAPIRKGSTGGGEGVSYVIRSCFCFSAIGMSASKQADTSRVTPLVLRRVKGEDGANRFAHIQGLWRDSVGRDGYPVSIRTRTLQLAKVIAENSLRFAQAVSLHTGERRLGQQLGTMLAGAFSLTSANIVTQEFANEWVAKRDWSIFKPDETEDDHNKALARLLETVIMLDAARDRPIQRMAIGEIIDAALHAPNSDIRSECNDLLLRHGIKVSEEGVYVSNSHAYLATVYKDTEWAGAWRVSLARVKGASPSKSAVRFGKGTPPTRSVLLPLELFKD